MIHERYVHRFWWRAIPSCNGFNPRPAQAEPLHACQLAGLKIVSPTCHFFRRDWIGPSRFDGSSNWGLKWLGSYVVSCYLIYIVTTLSSWDSFLHIQEVLMRLEQFIICDLMSFRLVVIRPLNFIVIIIVNDILCVWFRTSDIIFVSSNIKMRIIPRL